jgi:hypothetical protein
MACPVSTQRALLDHFTFHYAVLTQCLLTSFRDQHWWMSPIRKPTNSIQLPVYASSSAAEYSDDLSRDGSREVRRPRNEPTCPS